MTAAEYVPDNYDQFERYEREQAELEARWPKCPLCGELLEDEAYRIDDALICWDCAHASRRTDGNWKNLCLSPR